MDIWRYGYMERWINGVIDAWIDELGRKGNGSEGRKSSQGGGWRWWERWKGRNCHWTVKSRFR